MPKLQKAGQLQDVVTARGGTGTWGCGAAGEQPLEGQDPGGAEDRAAIVSYLRSLRRRCVTQFFQGYYLKSYGWTSALPSWAAQKGASILPSTVVAPSQMFLPSAQEGMCVS